MNIDTGLAIVIAAVLIFYLRLIGLQRERARRASQSTVMAGKKKAQARKPSAESAARYSILSPNAVDRTIAIIGGVLILAGVLLNTQKLPWLAAQPYWWLPTAIGIVLFSWAFKV